ncbi:nonstructural protein [Microvirus D_HF4_340]|nr:nonstructural protein [Microvirus D_HF4_340]
MKLIIVAVRDIKTDVFGTPIFVNHQGAAIRSFGDQCTGTVQNADQTLMQHPEDFELYKLGEYDDNTGEFSNEKIQLAVGSNYRVKQ